ncbi:metallophosphoesterase family protein [Cypionkella psychrotolerans]|uniref:metallophosphoesterase family protein n=1 Tax=Cypionkella psychrotolerans TaxID=1678131 RepID=UPI0006B5DD8B|nr:metallophosphoesterase [Cypionkella psychrotolerans]
MAPHAVAVLADVHFHDPGGDFGGAGIVVQGARLALRSWADTRIAARAFNETAGALSAALEKIAAAGVRHVVLAGDYSDDGQAENIRRLVEVLQGVEHRHGLRFYVIPGNHDLYGPHGKNVTTRFVSAPGQTVMVTSDAEQAEVGAIVTPAMRCGGQPAALLPMARFGLFRQPEYLHWESPFGLDDRPEARMYEAVSADGSVTQRLMDASYLVEPEPGLWLLMIDANVFEPRAGRPDATRKKAFIGPSDAGWNAVLRVKPFLLDWIGDVTARANALGKVLVSVSHYPVLDPFQDAAGSERALFGETAIVRRTPGPQVAQALIATGLRWHIGGHMHVNATTRTEGGRLTDLALPSLGAFPPAFKIVHASVDVVRAETISLEDVPPESGISAIYRAEGQREALPLGSMLAAQRRANVLERRLVQDWPVAVRALAAGKDAGFLVELAGGDGAEFARRHGLDLVEMSAWPLADLIADAYLIKVAGPLAAHWIAADRLALCRALAVEFGDENADPHQGARGFLQRFLAVLQVSLDRMDADDSAIIPVAADLSRGRPLRYPTAG